MLTRKDCPPREEKKTGVERGGGREMQLRKEIKILNIPSLSMRERDGEEFSEGKKEEKNPRFGKEPTLEKGSKWGLWTAGGIRLPLNERR